MDEDPYSRVVLMLLLRMAGDAYPWTKPEKGLDDYQWQHNEYLRVPRERTGYVHSPDVNADCAGHFGPYAGGAGKYNGCTVFMPDMDTGLNAMIYLPKRRPGPIQEHEEKHAQGWVHPFGPLK